MAINRTEVKKKMKTTGSSANSDSDAFTRFVRGEITESQYLNKFKEGVRVRATYNYERDDLKGMEGVVQKIDNGRRAAHLIKFNHPDGNTFTWYVLEKHLEVIENE